MNPYHPKRRMLSCASTIQNGSQVKSPMEFLSQVNFHALLAYLGPRELAGDTDGDEANDGNDRPPNAMLRGRAYQR